MKEPTPEFVSFIESIQGQDVATLYDIGSVDKAFVSLPGLKVSAAHCVFYSHTGRLLTGIPMKACVMVSRDFRFIFWTPREKSC